MKSCENDGTSNKQCIARPNAPGALHCPPLASSSCVAQLRHQQPEEWDDEVDHGTDDGKYGIDQKTKASVGSLRRPPQLQSQGERPGPPQPTRLAGGETPLPRSEAPGKRICGPRAAEGGSRSEWSTHMGRIQPPLTLGPGGVETLHP